MAYMRDPFYIYSDGGGVHISDETVDHEKTVYIPHAFFDALVVMRYAQIRELAEMVGPEQLDHYMESIAAEYEGNAGADALRRMYGLPTVLDEVRQALHEGEV